MTVLIIGVMALTRWELAHQPTRLRAERAQPAGAVLSESRDQGGFDFVETIYQNLAKAYLGFAWRHQPFVRLRDKVKLDDIWVVWENREPVGYVFVRKENLLLKLDIQILRTDIHAVEVIAAVASKMKTSYVQVTLSRPSDISSLQRAGWQVAHPNWEAFMVKPLVPDVSADDAHRLFGIGTDRFLVSWLDVT